MGLPAFWPFQRAKRQAKEVHSVPFRRLQVPFCLVSLLRNWLLCRWCFDDESDNPEWLVSWCLFQALPTNGYQLKTRLLLLSWFSGSLFSLFVCGGCPTKNGLHPRMVSFLVSLSSNHNKNGYQLKTRLLLFCPWPMAEEQQRLIEQQQQQQLLLGHRDPRLWAVLAPA